MTRAIMGLEILAKLAILCFAHPIQRLIGNGGAVIVSRIMGMMLATVTADSALRPFVSLGALNALP